MSMYIYIYHHFLVEYTTSIGFLMTIRSVKATFFLVIWVYQGESTQFRAYNHPGILRA